MATKDIPPGGAEGKVLDRSWRLWASVGVVAFTVIAAILGFLVLPGSGDEGVAGALGQHEHQTGAEVLVAAASLSTEVAWTQATLAHIRDASAAAGETIASQRCASCHGQGGITTSATFPSLAGQPATMIYKQLRDFADGHRTAAIMASMVASLDDQQMADIAAYYAAQAPAPRAVETAAILPETEILATRGSAARGLPACDACHTQRGGPEGTPVLFGLPAAYVQTQLQLFGSGQRGNDIYGLMREVARQLTPAEIEQLAAYYGN